VALPVSCGKFYCNVYIDALQMVSTSIISEYSYSWGEGLINMIKTSTIPINQRNCLPGIMGY
jgi:hypothetical protein